MKLEIQKFLETHKPEEAYDLYGIGSKRHPEFPSYFPELRPDFDKTKSVYLALLDEIRTISASLSGIASQKDFAGEALKHRFSAVLFSLRAKKFAAAEDFMRAATIYAVEKMLGMDGAV